MGNLDPEKCNRIEIDPNSTSHLVREEEAKLCLENTSISITNIWILIISLIFTILFVPVVQFIHESKAIKSQTSDQTISATALPSFNILQLIPGVRNLASADESVSNSSFLPNEKDIREYEDNLEEQSVVGNWILPRTQYILTSMFGAGNEQVYKGKDNWLFYRSDIDYVTGEAFLKNRDISARHKADPVEAIADFDRQLKDRGIQLIVMPAAPKPAIHPYLMSSRYSPDSEAVHNPSYREFIAELERKGIAVFDTTEVLIRARNESGSSQYLPSDTHWTPEAVELLAENLSGFINQKAGLSKREPLPYKEQVNSVTGIGDTAVMLDFPEGKDKKYRSKVTVRKVMLDNKPWKSDKSADILFMGDSFSNIYSVDGMGWGESAGIVERLSYLMKRPIDKISINAGGAYATREDLKRQLTRNTNRLTGKKVVIYEFAARELSSGDWRMISLPKIKKTEIQQPITPAKPVAPAQKTPEPAKTPEPEKSVVAPKPKPAAPANDQIVVEATIAAKSDSPTPGTVAYADCVIALHLRNISVSSGKLAPKEIVVFIWGMHKNKLTPAASFKTGQRVKLALKAWESVESVYGSYNRVELSDDNLLMLDIFWGEEIK